ncbi:MULTISPECIES: gephyrin-like molybdotransferase Glp [Kordiimonas]|jgi:molybdopterin molybdotransferase|uniref:molybdopterin molybdotransferase MoeA n=1 Tax=Kordiimonas TaxID=288021 RepID=UPI00257DB266|nr:gephyrin-like molybdotransferase Glp [Kordiimonas sp. UBA4487]
MFDPAHDCCSGPGLRHYVDCLEDLHREATHLEATEVELSEAIGQTLADDLKAPLSLPSFNNSAMDGFAFNSDRVKDATIDSPVRLPIVGASIAGDNAGLAQLKGRQAVKIMTGAPLPLGADTVLPVEAASWETDVLTFHAPYQADQHVRHIGQDVAQGKTILKAGTLLASQHLPLLSALGLGKVRVIQRPTAAWISTGQELVDDLSQTLKPGQIYNATGLYAAATARELGFDLQHTATVRDTPQDFAAALDTAIEGKPRIILSTGGVSAGQYDFVKPVLTDMGATIIFHKARIKPAKPVLFARLPGGSFFFGLPGNPISTALALRAFVYPFVRRLSGQAPEPMRVARLTRDVQVDASKTVFLMGRMRLSDSGLMIAIPNKRQQSFQTAPFAESNAWLMVPEGVSELSAGDQVHCLPFDPGSN